MERNFPLRRIVDDHGQLIEQTDMEQIDEQLVHRFYYHMYRLRTFDRKAISLQRQGRIGTYAPFEGQEAAQVGSSLALDEGDWLFPTYRDHGASLTFGADMVRTLLYWNGRVEGCVPPPEKNIFPPAVPIGTQLLHAVGVAWAEKKKGTKKVALVYFGDGATSEGDFHEGLNFASVFQTPTIFFNQNNRYAISVPIERQMNSKTVAQKSIAYGLRGIRVDGNDCFAVYFETKKAIELARRGEGPTLIEALTWRSGAHTTADDPSKYRPADAGKGFVDPLLRLERFMKQYGYWEETRILEWQTAIKAEVEEAVLTMEAYPAARVEDLFDHVFLNPPAQLIAQKESYLSFLKGE